MHNRLPAHAFHLDLNYLSHCSRRISLSVENLHHVILFEWPALKPCKVELFSFLNRLRIALKTQATLNSFYSTNIIKVIQYLVCFITFFFVFFSCRYSSFIHLYCVKYNWYNLMYLVKVCSHKKLWNEISYMDLLRVKQFKDYIWNWYHLCGYIIADFFLNLLKLTFQCMIFVSYKKCVSLRHTYNE